MNLLGLFAKYWTPGQVKTRLAAKIGDTQASQVYRAMLGTTLRRLDGLADQQGLAVTPAERLADFERLAARRWKVAAQSSGDLGARLSHFFRRGFADGATRVVVIGSDSPTTPPTAIERAFELLRTSPVVLGPTIDGGYYLVGMSQRVTPIFEDMPWSQPTLWRQTVSRLTELDCPFHALQRLYDVDEPEDLQRLAAELNGSYQSDPDFDELREVVQRALKETADA